MSALTKAEMAEKLFDELALKKCAPPSKPMNRSSCPDLAILICGTRVNGRAGTPRPAKKFRSLHVVW
jgi:hypothetical protein